MQWPNVPLSVFSCPHGIDRPARQAAPGLDLFRYSSPTGPVYAVNEPSFCIIVQASKELLLGNERYRYDASRYPLVYLAGLETGR